MKSFIIENDLLFDKKYGIQRGYWNGYVVIPENHILHSVHYDDIDVLVHGGLTFSMLVTQNMIDNSWSKGALNNEDLNKWIVGFDTAHYMDSIQT